MRYIDYIKIHTKVAAHLWSAAIIIYAIICYVGSIQPIRISIWMIARVLSFIFLTPLYLMLFDSLKK